MTDCKFGPNHRNGIRRIHVGCGPKNIKPTWWNVDIASFDGVDEVLDVSRPWPWSGIERVFAEHFLEHMPLEGALRFLQQAFRNLVVGGRLRLSTPSLEWVILTHFDPWEREAKTKVDQTLAINRAFRGWGHQILYSKELLTLVLACHGFEGICYHAYGESEDPAFSGLEQHGGYSIRQGVPSVWIVEAEKRTKNAPVEPEFASYLEEMYLKYVRARH